MNEVVKDGQNRGGEQALKGRPLEVKPREMKGDVESVELLIAAGEEPEVLRLSPSESDSSKASVKPAGVKPLEPRGEELNRDEVNESKWGQSSAAKSSSFKWLLIGGGAIFAITMVGLALTVMSDLESKKEDALLNKGRGSTAVLEEDTAESWFYSYPGRLNNDALSLLNFFLNAESDTARSQYVRNPKVYLQNSKVINSIIKPLEGSTRQQKWSISHTADRGYLRMLYKDENFMPLTVYFTRVGSELKLDTLASSGWSSISFENQHRELGGGDTAVMPCFISRKEEFYSGIYNEEEYAFYSLSSFDKMNTLWGYVKRDSALDTQLKSLLNHGSFIGALKKNVKVTLEIGRSDGGQSPKQVDILQLHHKEWVRP